jgi:hypothetical protein
MGLAELASRDNVEKDPATTTTFEEKSADIEYQNRVAKAILQCAGKDGKLDMSKFMQVLK